MEFRTIAFATILFVIGTILISSSDCSPVPMQPDTLINGVELSMESENTKGAMPQAKKQLRQGRYYMGYPMMGGLGYEGASASAAASASASSGGMGMGYGGYPYGGMYGK